MKELLKLLFGFRFRELFFEPTENGLIKFFRYCFVGGIAFVIDWGTYSLTLVITGEDTLQKVIGTTLGFITGMITNFLLSKKFVFTEDAKTGKKAEFFWYTVIGAVGLGLNILLILAVTEWVFTMNPYIAKVIVAMIVLVYNYLARKILLY